MSQGMALVARVRYQSGGGRGGAAWLSARFRLMRSAAVFIGVWQVWVWGGGVGASAIRVWVSPLGLFTWVCQLLRRGETEEDCSSVSVRPW